MSIPAFLTLKVGGSQVQGASRFKDRAGQILVIGLRHEIKSDRDANGLPTGSPKHRALVIQKEIDRASPFLHQAFATNVEFSEFLLELRRFPPAGGPEESYCMIGLTKPKIATIKSVMPNLRKPENEPLGEYEEIAFYYEQISWQYFGKGDGSGSGDSDFTEAEADFSKDGPDFFARLEDKLKEKAIDLGKVAGESAKETLKKLLADDGGGDK